MSATRALAIDLSNLEIAPGSTTGKVFRVKGGRASAIEVRVADRVGREVVLAPIRTQPGVDGVYFREDRAVSLKSVHLAQAQNQPRQVVTRANDAYTQALDAGFTDVDLYIDAPQTTIAEVRKRWSATSALPRLQPMPGGIIATVRVFCSDGSVDLPIPR
jgi:hypothetical protein